MTARAWTPGAKLGFLELLAFLGLTQPLVPDTDGGGPGGWNLA